jgi:hypothetical protein
LNITVQPRPIQPNQQQQQQHSLLSQASWGRLEIKPKRDEKQRDTERDINGTRQKDVTVQAR